MALRAFTTSAAMLALIAGIGTGALAQTAPAAGDLPGPLSQLNLRNLDIETRPDGMREVEGRTADGVDIEARIDMAGNLVGIEADDAAIPPDLVGTLLPQAVRDNEVIGQFDRIEQIVTRDGRVMVKGEDSGGQDMRADFDADGRVLRFGREDGPRGARGAQARHADHGPRHGRGPGHDDRMSDGRGDGPRRPAPVPADFDPVAVNQRLTQAGYSGFGFLRAEGPRLLLEATNPQGEAVTLELDRQGEVVRETAR
ncbi:hypothetical protein [Paracoccus sp. S3-43]|uniref:hypothetical protein n=1 Tax=Paracoccus sp. S3-43 TaxID=3030011 RepID=UPI0023AE773F|nr:hypothetical protein [Paracoccus sp. S3-43]WEF25342.1 hypothetical protein PXD02_05225 [Paracoccus sp. S3-43]